MAASAGPRGLIRPHSRAAAALVAMLAGSLAIAGCGVISKVSSVTHAVEGNKQVIEGFAGGLKNGVTTFEATYQTTGANPATVVYAVRPPNDLLFKGTSTGGSTGLGTADIVANSSGEYACAPDSSGSSHITCSKLDKLSVNAENGIFSFYTPAHWVRFLDGFAIAAGLAGDKVSTSTLTKNGFSMHCVDFNAPGVAGTSTICTTAQGLLGYVKVAGDSTSFELKSYSGSPPDSLFTLPAGATVKSANASS